MERKRKNPEDLLNIPSIISITVVALLLILLFKVKGGILGIVLGTIAVATLIYWLKEIKKILRERDVFERVKSAKEKKEGEAEWFYDLINGGEGVTLTAEVPGPAEEVEVRLREGVLEIRGGGNFMRRVQVPKEVELQDKSYINSVLHVRFQRLKRSRGFEKLINE